MGPLVLFATLLYVYWTYGYAGLAVGLLIALGTALTAARV